MVESYDTSISGRPTAGRPERVCFVPRVEPDRLDGYPAEFFADRTLGRLEEVFHLA